MTAAKAAASSGTIAKVRAGALPTYEAAVKAIAAAKRVDEAKKWHDGAAALRAYAKQAKNRQLEIDAAEIRIRAERRIGQIMEKQKAIVGLNKGGGDHRVERKPGALPTLKEAGIDKNLADRARKLAAVPEAEFPALVKDWRESQDDASKRVSLQIVRKRAVRRDLAAARAMPDLRPDLDALAASGQKFGAIYADPAWSFDTFSDDGKGRAAERHYQTMSLDDICRLPVAALAAADCALFLWVTRTHLLQAWEVISSWKFEFKTVAFTWVKRNRVSTDTWFRGPGFWTRSNAEYCLLATRGHPRRLATDVDELIEAPIGQHSQKPEEAARRIERLVAGPYLELNATRARDGWTSWGSGLVVPHKGNGAYAETEAADDPDTNEAGGDELGAAAFEDAPEAAAEAQS